MKQQSSLERGVAVIGDLVGSRRGTSRSATQEQLLDALAAANDLVPARQVLEPTIGDEFQGVYDDVPAALLATLVVRLALPEGLDARAGLGTGPIEVVGASRYGLTQDGPAWWSAREAVVSVKERERRVPGLRTWHGSATEPTDEGEWDAVNAYLLCRDAVVGGFDARQRRLVLGVLAGRAQKALASDEGISASAVSQSLRRSGALAVLASAPEVAR